MDLPLVDDRPQPAVLTAGDLRRGRECEFGLLVDLDVRLGRREAVPAEVDPVRERFGDLGRDYEQEVTDELTAATGDGVVDAGRLSPEQLLPLLRDPSVRLVHQAPVAGERFRGRADHLVRHDDETWVVAETKLARKAHTHALLQVAAYAEALASSGVTVAPFVRLILGDGTIVDTPREELAEPLGELRDRLLEVIDTHTGETGPARWEDPRWRALVDRRDTGYHRWRPQSVPGGAATVNPWKEHAPGQYVHTVSARSHHVPPEARPLVEEAGAGLDALAESMDRWLALLPGAFGELKVPVFELPEGAE